MAVEQRQLLNVLLSILIMLGFYPLLECDSHLILRQGCEVSGKELDSLLSLLAEKKRKMEQVEAETNLQIMLDFLHCLRKQKIEELNEVSEVSFISLRKFFMSGSGIASGYSTLCFQILEIGVKQ